jgi:predicted nucleic acid-binding protein
MILVDTPVWIDHLHHADATLSALLNEAQVCMQPMIIGELALGSLRDRSTVLGLLADLPCTSIGRRVSWASLPISAESVREAVELRYCGSVKNITVAVAEDVYRAARIRAAEQGTSVSALVSGYLESLATDDDAEFARLRDLQRRVSLEVANFSASDRLNREEVHDRAALR